MLDSFDIGDLLSQKNVKNGSAGILGLKLVLKRQGFKNILGIIDGQLG